MRKIYVVDLSEEEKDHLESLTKKGKTSARKLNRARVLLLANQGETDKQIAKAVGVGASTVERIRKRFVEEGGLEEALNERPRPGGERKSSMASRKLTSWRWLVATRRGAESSGRCSSWPTGSSS